MKRLGFHASHEQFKPSDLLGCAQLAEQVGFRAAMCSDHFLPWSERQGQSGFAWSWLGAAMQATTLPYGVVVAPGQRYHPAIIAQAGATLAELFPQRFWMAVGSGEALNEHITGEQWPSKAERNQRLKECVDVIRALWAGESVNHDGLIQVCGAQLYTRPKMAPPLIGAALSEETARWMGSWADGLITAGVEVEGLKGIVQAFRENGGANKPIALQLAIVYADSMNEALDDAYHQWRHAALDSFLIANLSTPKEFDDATEYIPREALVDRIRISPDVQQHCDWIAEYFDLGFDTIYLSHVGRDLQRFIDVFGESVLPMFNVASTPAEQFSPQPVLV